MIDMEKLATAKVWIEKLANGINPLNDELVKDVPEPVILSDLMLKAKK